jgi:hypothetical protein
VTPHGLLPRSVLCADTDVRINSTDPGRRAFVPPRRQLRVSCCPAQLASPARWRSRGTAAHAGTAGMGTMTPFDGGDGRCDAAESSVAMGSGRAPRAAAGGGVQHDPCWRSPRRLDGRHPESAPPAVARGLIDFSPPSSSSATSECAYAPPARISAATQIASISCLDARRASGGSGGPRIQLGIGSCARARRRSVAWSSPVARRRPTLAG